MAEKVQTRCCALSQIAAQNSTSREEILYILDKAKREREETTTPRDRGYGETAFFVITLENETRLVKTLLSLGFEPLTTFKRRVGYSEDLLTMYMIKY